MGAQAANLTALLVTAIANTAAHSPTPMSAASNAAPRPRPKIEPNNTLTLAAPWRREAQRIRTWIEEHCWSPARRSYLMHPGTAHLDAGVLLGARFGFDRGERMNSTIEVIRRELGHGAGLYRYTGMDQEEGAFIACTFWAVEALALCGRGVHARDLMERMLAMLAGAPLLTEMIDAAGQISHQRQRRRIQYQPGGTA